MLWPRFWRRLGWLVLIVGLGWGLLMALPGQADTRLESRVSRLEFDLRTVQAELRQLESRLSQSGSSAPIPRPAPNYPDAGPSLEEQFDNLATLAIELKQDLRALETRVERLEQ